MTNLPEQPSLKAEAAELIRTKIERLNNPYRLQALSKSQNERFTDSNDGQPQEFVAKMVQLCNELLLDILGKIESGEFTNDDLGLILNGRGLSSSILDILDPNFSISTTTSQLQSNPILVEKVMRNLLHHFNGNLPGSTLAPAQNRALLIASLTHVIFEESEERNIAIATFLKRNFESEDLPLTEPNLKAILLYLKLMGDFAFFATSVAVKDLFINIIQTISSKPLASLNLE